MLDVAKPRNVELWLVDLWRWLARRAEDYSNPTVNQTTSAPGSTVPDAAVTETQTDMTGGSPDPSQEITMANDVLIARAQREVDESIQKLMRVLYGDLITVDWVILADNVMGEEDVHVLHPAYSKNMSAWKATGIGITGLRYFAGMGMN
jgi:hypothetical protein